MFRCPRYLLDSVRKLMVRNGDLSLLGDYIVVGLGGGFDVLPQLLEDPRDVSGYARTIKTYTGYYKEAKVSVVAMGGGPSYTEWVVALAHMKNARALIGVGWCGALQEDIEIGDAVIPVATIRDEDTSTHYVDPCFPAIGDPRLVAMAMENIKPRIEKLGSNLWLGVTVTTSAMLAETPERIEAWRRHRALCVDGETSTLYTLSYLAGIPSLVLLAVSDNVVLGKDCGFETELSRKVDRIYQELAKGALEVITRLQRADTT
ncbi:hypothetical protein J4526_07045 [Desulfurococcaceae archaeon MEX13E-LK6-19]|nr:hypothetical protein J4526_07045 [Desulfurococcaceae archaeon MEX13E-LK6-19]